mgnify:CR=1 FL=1
MDLAEHALQNNKESPLPLNIEVIKTKKLEEYLDKEMIERLSLEEVLTNQSGNFIGQASGDQ